MHFDDLTPPETGVLVDLLSDVDVLWTPPRQSLKALAAIHQRRKLYASAGVPTLAAGLDCDRKSAERTFYQLEDDGFIQITTRHQRRHCRLSDACDWLIRSLVACYVLSDVWLPLLVIRDMCDALGVDSILETDVIGVDYDSDPDELKSKIFGLEMMLAPAAARLFVTSDSDAAGRVSYSLADAGREFLRGDIPTPPDNLPPFNEVFSDRFDARFKQGLAQREHWRSTLTNDIGIPRSAGFYPNVPHEIKRLSLKYVVDEDDAQ